MILQALCDYYRRKSADPTSGLAAPGFERKEIPFVIVVDEDGRFIQIDDMREGVGKKQRAKPQLVPQSVKKSANIAANLLWDNVEYALGIDTRGNPERVRRQHEAFRSRLFEVFGPEPIEPGVKAVAAFLDRIDETQLVTSSSWAEMKETNPFIAFRLSGDPVLVAQRPEVVRHLESRVGSTGEGICIVTGNPDSIARLHPALKGVRGGQSSGGNIVSFNLDAFCSYAKEQGKNAPVGERAAFAYTTGLNSLLGRDSRQKLQVGDATTVFWAEKASGVSVEEAFAGWFDPPRDDPDANVERVRALYEFKKGKPLTADDQQSFYVLGLAPNAARVSVRFWQVATVRELGERVFRHFADLEIVRSPGVPQFPSLCRLLSAVAPLADIERVPPALAGDWMRAILAGLPYPLALLQAAVRRCRAEREVGYFRAALIKACLIRMVAGEEEKLTVSLDANNTNAGYRLGRLFATFEKIQEEANPGINATIRDRYFSSASSNPLVAFPILNRLKNHHLAKLDNRGRAVNFERLIGDIMEGLDAAKPFLPSLTLGDQGRFAVGYYHQRQKFFERTGGDE